MSSLHSNLLLEGFAPSWKIARYSSPSFTRSPMLTVSQQTIVNKQAIESLGYRAEALVDSLCVPASEGDVKEKVRRKELEQ